MDPHPLIFDPDSLYILLSDLGDAYRFHWGILLATTPTSGTIFHLINPDISNKTLWAYETKCSDMVASSARLLVGVKIAPLEPVLHAAAGDFLKEIPIADSQRFKENISCRVWVLEALYELDNSGFINLSRL
ncbi:hypothetical protein EMCG_05801 [[Emmonsia] crescens]|uniref:Uncharacterized protein n=1 Tax=[Emmonsia] crescens TaxID=73230 RepID=A0A0G2ICY3_9EURO|nr:hypothetical protein EMCG_05801 [Emmonsia crescens UAMH 3008]